MAVVETVRWEAIATFLLAFDEAIDNGARAALVGLGPLGKWRGPFDTAQMIDPDRVDEVPDRDRLEYVTNQLFVAALCGGIKWVEEGEGVRWQHQVGTPRDLVLDLFDVFRPFGVRLEGRKGRTLLR
jgi:hypothetical protein